jgi:fumarylacetoacetase
MQNTLKTWATVPVDSDFTIYNLPIGVFQKAGQEPRLASIIGDHVIDMVVAADLGVFDAIDFDKHVLARDTANDYISLGKKVTSAIRLALQTSLCSGGSPLSDSTALIPVQEVKLLLPVYVRDYTDFYSSIEHATNVGKMFRDPENALLPNWRHLPVGYHGRASSIVVSGTDIHRPCGQTRPVADAPPVYGPSKRLDFELEMAFVVGQDTQLGDRIDVNQAEDYIFGLCLFNDWSARDIQKWEYVPLGPFLGKSFASSVSPWIVPLEAFADYRVDAPEQTPEPLPYLQSGSRRNIDIQLAVDIRTSDDVESRVSTSNFKYMYWSMAQQLTHHTVNGCNVHVGDMMASGTISGKDESSYGSMLEISWAGKRPVTLADGTQRSFIADGDTVVMRGHAGSGDRRVGFGAVEAKVLPAK